MNSDASEFATVVATTLGVDVYEAGSVCCLCGAVLDGQGKQPLSCMSGGVSLGEHNAERDIFFDYCGRDGLRLVPDGSRVILAEKICFYFAAIS